MNFHNVNPNLNRDEFIEQLRRECSLRFEPEVTDALVAEVDAHITESIQARLELGEAQHEAEINAVRSFHRPRKFVQSMGQVHHDETTHDRPLLTIGLIMLCWLAFYMEIAPKHLTWMVGPLVLILFGITISLRSHKIGSIRWGTVKRLALAAVIVVGIIAPLRTVNLWAYGGMGYMPTRMASQMVSDQDGYIRSNLGPGNWGTNWVMGDIEKATRYDLDPARRALAAPLWERYIANSAQTIPSLIFSLGLILFAHLVPIAVRRRLNQRRLRPGSA